MQPSAQTMEAAVCGVILGEVSESFRAQLMDQLPGALQQVAPTWTLDVLDDNTDALMALLDQDPGAPPPWTALLVTSELTGTWSLADTLVALKQRWPTIRYSLLVPRLTATTRELIALCAAYRCYNIAVGEAFPLSRIVQLITEDQAWDSIAPYLASEAPPIIATPSWVGTESSGVLPTPTYTVAVISGKGGVGKTGLIANLLMSSAPWDSVGIDLDYIKPSLPLYFHEAQEAPTLDLRSLLMQIATHHRAPMQAAHLTVIEGLTSDDRQDIEQYVRQAETVSPSARIVPGASRFETVMPVPPTVVMSAILEACQRHARFIFVDTPGVPTDPVWIHSVQHADFVVIVTTPEYAVVLETIDLVRKLDLLQVPRAKRGLVINKRSKWGFSTESICGTQLPGIPLLGTIPYDPVRWERSLQQHRPLALDHPKPWHHLFQAITQVTPPRSRRGWFRRHKESG
ncbi:hypothetical protein BXT84_00470 [Sulfobacillus thermotolerans]|uniref:CobQ/CobB/MinD/ParA nucleotide binding domain-containing protein n=1 Tax=Sulfobacillus thermotolerans TaxID=338644 RepID=A0ABM6RMR7_9FIRM|nr:hypothetical protein BXT84_00470 [Sulfobacillus thermotolerans]